VRRTVVVCGVFFLAAACQGGTIYVDADAPGANNGTSWLNAYCFLQDAITAAASGDTIQVAQGICQPDANTAYPNGSGDRAASFWLKNGVTLKGGYAGYGQPDPNARNIRAYESILSGDLNEDDGPNFTNRDDNSFFVLKGGGVSPTAILDGFVITGGDGSSAGGGMNCYDSSPTILSCIFVENRSYYGGGIRCDGSSITIINSLFIGNRTLEGGISSGGGMYITGSGSVTIINCTFSNNQATSGSGGIRNSSAGTNITNSILWGNINQSGTSESAQIMSTGSLNINHCCVQGWTGGLGGVSNIGDDPLFVDANGADDILGTEDDNLHLLVGSPCIDTGDNSTVPSYIVTDLDGHPRIVNDTVDRGVYEYSEEVEPIINVSPSALEFYADEGGANPAGQTLNISNIGTGILNWHITSDCNWLEAEPNNGSSAGEVNIITVSVNMNGIKCGIYESNLIITDPNAANSPRIVTVTLDVNGIWSNHIIFGSDLLTSEVIFESDPRWVKFTIKLDDPCTVYFQNSKLYPFHYHFATEWLEPFIGMSVPEYYNVTLYDANQQASLGAVILPPMTGNPPAPEFLEYGIQFVRYDLYTKEEIANMFTVVKNSVIADPCVTAFYFPTYEQLQVAEENQVWFESQGIPIGSIAHWIEGNICYSAGWAIGELKYFPGDEIQSAYLNGELLAEDILLTDGVPAEIPFVAGIITLSPSTQNSHMAILSRTYGIPFVYLAVDSDIEKAWQLVNDLTLLCVQEVSGVCVVQLKDAVATFTPEEIEELFSMKTPTPLDISPMAAYGDYSANTDNLLPEDINHFGGKASNYGMLRTSIPDNSPVAVAISFDLWNGFMDQPLTPGESVIIDPCGHVLFWADDQTGQGPMHTNFKLSKSGEDIGLFDVDGTTLISGGSFGEQITDASFARIVDGAFFWVFFYGSNITPNTPNPGTGPKPTEGLFINELMADNDTIVADEYGEYDDWVEIYNAGPTSVDLGGMYLTDDLEDPTKWMISVGISGSTLREEIVNRLAGYTYPVSDLGALSVDLATVRNIITNPNITHFSQQLEDAIIAVLQDPNYGFDPNKKIRFRSSTNVEDAEKFTGAGLYDSFSGCLADDLDGDEDGPCRCDPNESNERGVFRAIRKVFASFYNDNAFLERLRHDVNEQEVGMALLVHHSFPDEIELANGVATMEKKLSPPHWNIKLATQKGATPVTNPEEGALPEEVSVYAEPGGGMAMTLIHQSNLVILGETVMEWQADYNDLTGLLVAAAQRFEEVTGKTEYILDFEYKKVAPGGAALPAGGIEVDQIREIPPLDAVSSTCPSFNYSCYCIGYSREHIYEDPATGVSIESSYCLYCPGICITDMLESWCRTIIRGYTTKPVVLVSSLSQSYSAGPHNWCEQLTFTPHLEPGMDQCLLNQLRAQDIRDIYLANLTYCGTPYHGTTGFGSGPYYLGDSEPDGDVDLIDFARFAQRWLDSGCGFCGGADFDCDEEVGLEDLAEFVNNWLAGK
jgi:hypothetical protein